MLVNADTFVFQQDTQPKIGLTNFWPPEDGFVWSTGAWCEIAFPFPVRSARPGGLVEIAIDLDVFKAAPDLEGQNVFFYVNGLRRASRFITGRVIVLLEAAASTLTPTENILTIDTPDAVRPSQHGQGDTRRLGIQMFSLQIRDV
jgi:hypothetical protein